MSDHAAIHVTLDGVEYRLSPDDFTGVDDLAIYREIGVTLAEIFRRSGFTLFTVAALIWRWRVTNGEADLTFEQVNASMTFEDLLLTSDEPSGGPPAPEA